MVHVLSFAFTFFTYRVSFVASRAEPRQIGIERDEAERRKKGWRMTEKTLSVEEARRELGLGRNGAYAAVKRGDIPVLKLGRKLRVPVAALDKMLAEAGPLAPNSTNIGEAER